MPDHACAAVAAGWYRAWYYAAPCGPPSVASGGYGFAAHQLGSAPSAIIAGSQTSVDRELPPQGEQLAVETGGQRDAPA